LNKEAKCGAIDVTYSHALGLSFDKWAVECFFEEGRIVTEEAFVDIERLLRVAFVDNQGDECLRNAVTSKLEFKNATEGREFSPVVKWLWHLLLRSWCLSRLHRFWSW
jgi:hypothetical protein